MSRTKFDKEQELKDSKDARLKVRNQLPQDLLLQLTVLIQNSGYVSINPIKLTREDWRRVNEKVKEMGGVWISGGVNNHWSIPLSWTR